MKKLIIIGSGGHSRPVIDAAKLQKKWSDIKIIDINFKRVEKILGFKTIGNLSQIKHFDKKETDFFIAIGDNKLREKVFKNYFKKKNFFQNIIHPKSNVSEFAKLGNGNYIGPFVNIGPKVFVGNQNIINSYANIEHEVLVKNFSQIAPNSVVCGRSIISNNVFLGANSTIIDNIKIPRGVTIGAGSLVINQNLKPNSKYIGVPVREL